MIICVYIFSIYLCQNHGKSVMALLCRVLFFMKIVAQLTFDFRSYCRAAPGIVFVLLLSVFQKCVKCV